MPTYSSRCAAFAYLDHIQPGDKIVVETKTDWYVYSVDPMPGTNGKAWKLVDPNYGAVILPVPDDGPAALAFTIQTLRELRGDCHIHACAAMGLTPLEAMVARDGTERAQQFGWPEPFPDAVAARH